MDAFQHSRMTDWGSYWSFVKFVLKFAIEDWRTNCRLKNADYGRVLAQSNDGLGDHIEILLRFAIQD